MKLKKSLEIILSILIILGIAPFGNISTNALTEYTSGYYKYILLNGGVAITQCDTSISGEVTIPSTINGYPVTTIDDHAFMWCESITGIVIPDSVISIARGAFYQCSSLKNITIPDSVNSIGYNAFIDSGYYNDQNNWENGALYIGNYLIKATSSVSGHYKVKDNTKIIASSAFSDCRKLTSVSIPDSVISMDNSLFCNCECLTSIDVSTDNTKYFSINGVLFNKSGDELLCYPAGRIDTSFLIPDVVTSIGKEAFSNCTNLRSVTITDSVTSIGDWAFYNCKNLTSITISEYVTSIGDSAFENCTSLTSITIPDSITSISDYAFSNCASLKSIIIPDSITSIGMGVVYNCTSLKDVTYKGTKEQFDDIDIGSSNDWLLNAQFTYFIQNTYDIDSNGAINAIDMAEIMKIIINDSRTVYDINGDDEFDIRDLVAIKEITAKQ